MNRSLAATALTLFVLTSLGRPATAAAGVPPGPPRVSPMATISQVVGVSEIEITYSRPGVKGRTIWGELVPWDEVWRTGANEATTIRFSDPVRVDGQPLPAGTYSLFTIPSREEWTVIFNREAEQWGAFAYQESEDALRIRVKPRAAPFRERFEIAFTEVGTDSALVSLRWEELEASFGVQFDLQAATIARAREFVAAATPGQGRQVWSWANYFYQNDFNLDDALDWASRLAQSAPMYWTHALEARLLARAGRAADAVAAAQKALERAAQEAEQQGVEADSQALAAELEEWKSPSG